MPKKTEDDRISRSNAIEKATKNAIETPLLMMGLSLELLKLSKQIAKIGNKNSLSDAGVASEMAFSSINGAYMNVLINLKDITDTIKIINGPYGIYLKHGKKMYHCQKKHIIK